MNINKRSYVHSSSRRMGSNELHIQGQPSAKLPSTSSSTVASWWPTTTEGAFKFMISIKVVTVDTQAAPIPWSLPMEVEITVAIVDSITGMGAILASGISMEAGAPSRFASSPSLYWSAGSREPLDKAGPEMSSMPCHSSSKGHQMLLHCFELWLQCCPGSLNL